MPRHACNKARDSPALLPDCELSRHNPGRGIMTQVVETWSLSFSTVRDIAFTQKFSKNTVDRVAVIRSSIRCGEEDSFAAAIAQIVSIPLQTSCWRTGHWH